MRQGGAMEDIPQFLVDDLDALWILLGAFLVFFMQVRGLTEIDMIDWFCCWVHFEPVGAGFVYWVGARVLVMWEFEGRKVIGKLH